MDLLTPNCRQHEGDYGRRLQHLCHSPFIALNHRLAQIFARRRGLKAEWGGGHAPKWCARAERVHQFGLIEAGLLSRLARISDCHQQIDDFLFHAVNLLMELHDLYFGSDVDFVLDIRAHPIFRVLPVLAHHDDGRL